MSNTQERTRPGVENVQALTLMRVKPSALWAESGSGYNRCFFVR